MRCSEFLLRYSDFRDETIEDPRVRRQFVAHVSRCDQCARYHHIIDRGVSLLHAAEPIEPSRGFRKNLARSLAAAIVHPEPVFAVPVRFVGSMVVAAAVGILLVEGVTRDTRQTPPAPEPPSTLVQTHARPPFVTFGDLEAPSPFLNQSWISADHSTRASQALVSLTALADPE